ncbi:MAG: hypothetical protein JO372_20700 [Solirubrobacterales bacterium]|nr:hypothetical protein [Solirubrobacterales bacterium]
MSKRSRLLAFGSAGALVLVGVVCGVVVGGGTGQVLALVLIGLGLVAATSLVFLEVGLSEDRERAREDRRRRASDRKAKGPRAAEKPSHRSRFERSRGHRRRLK